MPGVIDGLGQQPRWPSVEGALPRVGGGENDVAVVIGIDSYDKLQHVPGAADNARAWQAWLVNVRGVSADRVALLVDDNAYSIDLRPALVEAAHNARVGATLWFIYIGQPTGSCCHKTHARARRG